MELSEIENEVVNSQNIQDILKKKFGSVQTGGKGTVRRKKKVKSKIISTRISEEEKQFNKLIENTNNNINLINQSEIDCWNVYMEDYIFDMVSDLKKKDLKKKDKSMNIDNVKDNYEDIFSENLITKDNNKYLLLKNFKYFKNLLSDNGYLYLCNNIDYLEKVITKKEYIYTKKDMDIDNIDDLYNLLDLDKSSVPTKIELKKAYLKKSSEVHPDKHPNEIEKYSELFQNVNNAYKTLLNYHFNNNDNHLFTTE